MSRKKSVFERIAQRNCATSTPAWIHEGVRVTEFAKALTGAGLTFSNVAGRGLVIHRIGQDPERPMSSFTEKPA